MRQSISIVTVAFSGELKMLKLQARSLQLFAEPSFVDAIHIIIHDKFPALFRRTFFKEIAPEYGDLASKLVIHDYRDILEMQLEKPNWRSQQAVKLAISKKITQSAYLILDSKNHLIRQLTPQMVFDTASRMRIPMQYFHEPYRDYFSNACAYFGGKAPTVIDVTLPTTTPFLMSTDMAVGLVKEIEAKEQKPFAAHFLANKDYNEFYLYFAYLLMRQQDLTKLYNHVSTIGATHFDTSLNNSNRIAFLEKCLSTESTYCMGVHRRAVLGSDAILNQHIIDNWLHFGLIKTKQEGNFYLTADLQFADTWRNTALEALISRFC